MARLTDAAGGGGSVALLRWGEKRRGGRRGQGDGEGEKEEALSRFFFLLFCFFQPGGLSLNDTVRHSETPAERRARASRQADRQSHRTRN